MAGVGQTLNTGLRLRKELQAKDMGEDLTRQTQVAVVAVQAQPVKTEPTITHQEMVGLVYLIALQVLQLITAAAAARAVAQ